MNLGGVLSCSLVLLFLLCQATCEDTYDIPVTINPLIQGPVEITETVKFFYDMDKAFYSRVTVIDAALNAEQRVRDTIKKTINVVFLTVASSHVSRTLVKDDLRYKTRSNWSYTVDVNSILEASQGTLTSINHDTIIYKIQENAMKVLEKRFQFQSSEILTQLSLERLDYYAVDEAKWINVVGIIVKKVIESRSKTLHLTSCYLGDMLGKTVAQMEGFTLQEVDMYIYNTTMLLLKLPEYRDDVIKRLYQTFKMTPADLANISDTDVVTINNMILHDVLQLFTSSVLEKLRVTANEITEKDSRFDSQMLLSCNDKWNPFLAIIIPESFDNSAEAMVIEVETLSALINITYNEIKQFTITEMINLLEITIDPLSADKKLVETTLLSDVLKRHGSDEFDQENDNIFGIIHRFTNFTEHQLTILYEWTSNDYLFSSMFFLEDVNNVCTIDPLNYDLLALARLTVGQMGDIPCQSFNVLREISDKKSVDFFEYKYSPGEQLRLDTPISMMVSQLTKAPSIINYRVLDTTSEVEALISKLSINNITAVTTYQSHYLKKQSFQDIIGIIVHLKRNGSFDRQVTTRIKSTMLTSTKSTTTTIVIPKEITSSARVEPSSTVSVITTNTLYLTEGLTTKKPSTNINQPSSALSAVDKPSLTKNSHTTSINVPHIETSSPYLSTIPTPPISSQPTEVSTTLLAISMVATVKPNTTKLGASSSSIHKPAATCKPECKAHESCISNSQTASCRAAQNLEGDFRITNGANFTDDLKDKNSNAFQKLAIQIEQMIDSIYKGSQYSSAYLGAQVLTFEQGSIIVVYKLSFGNAAFALSNNTLKEMAQVFRNAQYTNFTIDNSSITIADYNECLSGLATKCHKTATCSNTLGSYECICPENAAGDGTTCQVVNSAQSEDKEVPWIIYVVIAIMVLLIIFLVVVIIYCHKKHKKKHRPQVLDFHNGGINMYPRSTSYLAQTPESEADLADGLGIVNRHAPQLNMVTFNPTPSIVNSDVFKKRRNLEIISNSCSCSVSVLTADYKSIHL